MTDETTPPVKLRRTARGKKPVYFDETTDKLLSMVLVLTGELSVMRDRLDTVELLAEQRGVFLQSEIDLFEITPELHRLRDDRRAAYLARVMKCVQDDIDRMTQDAPHLRDADPRLVSALS